MKSRKSPESYSFRTKREVFSLELLPVRGVHTFLHKCIVYYLLCFRAPLPFQKEEYSWFTARSIYNYVNQNKTLALLLLYVWGCKYMVHLCINSIMNDIFFLEIIKSFYISLQNSKKSLAACSMDTTGTCWDVRFSLSTKKTHNKLREQEPKGQDLLLEQIHLQLFSSTPETCVDLHLGSLSQYLSSV